MFRMSAKVVLCNSMILDMSGGFNSGDFLVILRFNLKSINPSNSLVIVLLLMLPLFVMLFLMRSMCPSLLPPSENASKPTFTPRHDCFVAP